VNADSRARRAGARAEAADLGFTHRSEPGTSGDTLLLLHGTGGDEQDLIPLGRRIAPHANLLSPRGKELENGMPRFFRRLALGVFDEANLVERAGELGRFVRAAAERHGFDPARVRAFGYSNGANMAAALLLLDGPLLSGAALLRAVLPLTPQPLPDLAGKPVLIAAGRHDPYAPIERVEALADRLARAGAVVDLRWTESGHAPESAEIDSIAAWLANR
jgi:phospholipase/carboxylesterase